MKTFLAALALLVLVVAFPAPSQAQISAISFQRVSAGLTVEYAVYKPDFALEGLSKKGEVKVALPIAYNLGRFSSLQGKVRYGVTSKVYEYSGGITFHILARGGKP